MAAPTPDSSAITVFEWTVPRPTGRWHRSIALTAKHLWLMPEMAFGDHRALLAAAEAGEDAFAGQIKATRWTASPRRQPLDAVGAMKWDETTGWLRVRFGDEIVGAMIPDRTVGTDIAGRLRLRLAAHRRELDTLDLTDDTPDRR